ncbi:MAG: arabinan endo,5-alpha-L-arabinosidase, partial [Mucilaginibacter sp.]|nr:arabinan endo,5-alpha-L-arabinosidase [Mucilaginibacter sp.]
MNSITKITSIIALALWAGAALAQESTNIPNNFSGNPIFKGWYADPEVRIFGKAYWIYPTYSARYKEQVFMDAFSSSDLVHWTKHSNIIDSNAVKWVKKALWAPAITEKGGKYYLFFGANDIHDDKKEIGGIG